MLVIQTDTTDSEYSNYSQDSSPVNQQGMTLPLIHSRIIRPFNLNSQTSRHGRMDLLEYSPKNLEMCSSTQLWSLTPESQVIKATRPTRVPKEWLYRIPWSLVNLEETHRLTVHIMSAQLPWSSQEPMDSWQKIFKCTDSSITWSSSSLAHSVSTWNSGSPEERTLSSRISQSSSHQLLRESSGWSGEERSSGI